MDKRDTVLARLQPGGGLSSLRGVFDSLGETLPGSQLGEYRVGQRTRRSGALQEFEAYRADGVVGSTMALQVLFGDPQSEHDRVEFGHRLGQLVRCRHPVLAPPIAGGVTPEGLRFVVASQIDGTPLDRYCELACLPIRQRLKLLLVAIEALAYVHRYGLVHGCFHPDEIVVDRNGHVRLRHAACSWLFSDRYGGSVYAPASPVYSTPESLLGDEPTLRSDVYQLGVTIARVLFGASVTTERRLSHAISEAVEGRGLELDEQRFQLLQDGDSQRLLSLVRGCIHGNPTARFPSVDLVRAELESICSTFG